MKASAVTRSVERTIATPLGRFGLCWAAAGEAPSYRGDPAAIAWFREDFIRMRQVSGRAGMLLDPVWLTPEDVDRYCQSERYGVRVFTGAGHYWSEDGTVRGERPDHHAR